MSGQLTLQNMYSVLFREFHVCKVCRYKVGIFEESFQDNLSEWLRRQTRNLLGFARAGSNPAVVVFVFLFQCLGCDYWWLSCISVRRKIGYKSSLSEMSNQLV